MDGIWLKRAWGGEVGTVSVLVAIGVNQEGYCEVLGVAEAIEEELESWRGFFRYLKHRGLERIRCWSRTSAWVSWMPCTNTISTPAGSVAQSIFTGMCSESRLGARVVKCA